MKNEITINDWYVQLAHLVQALLGSISSNFRMVALSHDGVLWHLIFVIELDNNEDREEIEDIGFEFSALQDTNVDYIIDLIVSGDPIPWPEESVRVVFRRRER
jgi:hypothetical protein